MKKIVLGTITLMVMLGVSVSIMESARQTQDPAVLLRAAIDKEEVEGNLQGAIDLYKQIVAKHSDQSAVAAKAQLRIGMCYEKLGNAEAIKAYEAVLSRFPKESEAVAEARTRLAALRTKEPAGLTMSRLLPPEVYLECQTVSPDGTKVAGINFSKGQNVAVYDLTAGKLEFITNFGWEKESSWTYVPIWSPDGREVAYQSGSFGAAAQELWTSTLGGKSRLLFKNPHGNVAPCDWLTDGSAIVAILENENKTYSLGLVPVKEGGFRELYRSQRPSGQRGDPVQAAMGASADASPDGRFIAFSDGPPEGSRDIYSISMDGESKVSLIDHPADDKEPRWSPDGRHIVFLSNRHGSWALWGLPVRDGKTDGQPFMILEGMENAELSAWTNEGLLSRSFASVCEIYNLEIDPQTHSAMGKPRVLDSSEMLYFPIWSPDGQYLSYFSYSRAGELTEMSIVIAPANGGKARRHEFSSDWMGGSGQWLPDGSGIGYVYRDKENRLQFLRFGLGSGELKILPIPTGEFSPFRSSIVWSGDGKAFYYKGAGENGSGPGIIVHDLETGQQRFLVRPGPDEPLPGGILKASRDGKRLALGGNGKLVLIDTETGRTERLEYKKEKLRFPAWSPDGKYLVAAGRAGEGGDFNEIFIVSLRDGKVKSLDISPYLTRGSQIISSPDWSPDGRKIVFDTRMMKNEANLIQNVIPKK